MVAAGWVVGGTVGSCAIPVRGIIATSMSSIPVTLSRFVALGLLLVSISVRTHYPVCREYFDGFPFKSITMYSHLYPGSGHKALCTSIFNAKLPPA